MPVFLILNSEFSFFSLFNFLSPISDALNSDNKDVIGVTLTMIQRMVKASDLIGPGLVPFYRQLLPMFNAYKTFEGKD